MITQFYRTITQTTARSKAQI